MTVRRTTRTFHKTAATLAVLGASMLGATACSMAFGEKTVEKASVEAEIGKLFTKTNGTDPSEVKCKDDLKAEVGATVACAVRSATAWQDVEVIARSVDGDQVNYDIRIKPGTVSAPSW